MSGGGGWGKKQGLLALDPDVNFDSSSDEEMQRLVQYLDKESSSGRNHTSQSTTVRPGCYVQFFIAPSAPTPIGQTRTEERSVSFGVMPAHENEEDPDAQQVGLQWSCGHFGGLSTHIHVDSAPHGLVETKIDVPYAVVAV